jgi:predicted transcriptional regulator
MRTIKVGIATEDQVNREFIDAWHRAERNAIKQSEERLYFLKPDMFLNVFSKRRLSLLHTLRTQGMTNVRILSQVLQRNYKNVARDVRILKAAGLVHQTDTKEIFVPWDKIQAEIDLAEKITT